MRVVIDTNVFVSAALKVRSLPAIAVNLALQRGNLLKSIATETQIFDVLARPYFANLIAPEARAWVMRVLTEALLIEIVSPIRACRDPTDDKFLELAVAGGAGVILTGNKDLLTLHPFQGIPIVAPAAFVRAAAIGP